MSYYPPILIVGPPRCGDTLLAGLLKAHGVWIGEAKTPEPNVTGVAVGTENTEIKAYLKSLLGPEYKPWSVPLPKTPPQASAGARERVLGLVRTDGPWLVKMIYLLTSWELWLEAFPEAKWVLPLRSEGDLVQSALHHPMIRKHGEAKVQEFMHACLIRQLRIYNVLHSIRKDSCRWFDVHYLFEPGASQIYGPALFDWMGVDFDPDILNAWAKKDLWHGSNA